MQLFKFKIPETEHLPVAEREEILRRCINSEEMRRYKRIAPPVCGVAPTAFALAFLFTALFRWDWDFLFAFVDFMVILVVSLVFALVTKIALEVWILRRLIRREISR
jgi:hypothetical protein